MNLKLISYVYIIIAMIIMFIPLSSQLMLRDTSGSSISDSAFSVDEPETEIISETEKIAESTETETNRITALETVLKKEESEKNIKKEIIIQIFSHSEGKIIEMPLEEYLVGVVMAEMPYNYEMEALKAQAVAARSYCLYRMNHGGVPQHNGVDVCTSFEHCAAYISEDEAAERYGKKKAEEIRSIISKAVSSTAGKVLLYDGEPIAAMFHSSSYKRTETAQNLWGYDVPYLHSVNTPEADVKSEFVITADELYSKVGGKGKIPYLTFYTTKNNTGRVDEVTIGDITVKAKDLRSVLGLKSCRFEISQSDGIVTFNVHGNGHGIGMSQVGANELAKQGNDYVSILLTYYSGVKIGNYQK